MSNIPGETPADEDNRPVWVRAQAFLARQSDMIIAQYNRHEEMEALLQGLSQLSDQATITLTFHGQELRSHIRRILPGMMGYCKNPAYLEDNPDDSATFMFIRGTAQFGVRYDDDRQAHLKIFEPGTSDQFEVPMMEGLEIVTAEQ